MADEPTPPNLGNLSDAAFRALPDWAVNPTNQPDAAGVVPENTWAKMMTCCLALFYELVRENFAYENLAWGCNVSTPLLEKVNSLVGAIQWRATDNSSRALTLADIGAASIPTPNVLYSCNATLVDEVTSVALLNVAAPTTPHAVYCVVNAHGGAGIASSSVVYGLRGTANRWFYAGQDITPTRDTAIMASCNVTLEWPQDSSVGSKIVLLKVADWGTATETGATKRIGFEFGVSKSALSPPDDKAHGTDYVLYLRWFDSGDVEQIAFPTVNGEAVSIGLHREVTLAFQRYEVEPSDNRVRFFVNGVEVGVSSGHERPSIGSDSDMRLHVGANQLGANACGGPINNVYVLGSPPTNDESQAINAIYRLGAGYLDV